ncbi:MAG: VOC family protein [Flavobacteriaceae bacterium]|nr:VOC family protein [Flavobacteriaceae bacterium]
MKIEELILFTNNLEQQVDFYATVLEFQIINSTPESCSFKIGQSTLVFQYKKDTVPYHFAFNIPSNKEDEALKWLKERVEILPFDENEIIDFSSWNAKSIYFYDADKNIVEFIARKNLNINFTEKFSSKSILNISEIGVATMQIPALFKRLNQILGIDVFSGDFERFCAVGDENGLFIIVHKQLKKWFPTGDKIYDSDFIIKGDYNFEFKNGKIIEIT